MNCPKCGSEKVEQFLYMKTPCVRCHACGFDESEEYDIVPEQKGQKNRAHYRSGGGQRSQKQSGQH